MKPSVALDQKRGAVREAASRFRAANPRVFGSVLRGDDRDGSDLDLLVDPLVGCATVPPVYDPIQDANFQGPTLVVARAQPEAYLQA